LAYFLAVANRKGGVGKSTTAVMLAHALAAWGRKRVLVVDLDSQCNSSMILAGGQGWLDAKNKHTTIADYFFDLYEGVMPNAKDYLIRSTGDVAAPGQAGITLIPGSLLLDDVQGELFLKSSRESNDHEIVSRRVQGKIKQLIKRFESDFDVVLMDCPPGISFAALAAIQLSQKVLVPFRPDYVSQFAVERVAMLIEDKATAEAVSLIAKDKRRYVTLANFVEPTGQDRFFIDLIADEHPILATQLPLNPTIARSFSYVQGGKRSIEEKYGPVTQDVRKLYDELSAIMGG
jgi:chromosome partitioning protein